MQSLDDWELLVVDDASSDGIRERMATIAEAEPRVRWIESDGISRGPSIRRNQGLAASSGDFVVFLDSDDLLAPHALASRLASFDRDPMAELAIGQGMSFRDQPDETGRLFNVLERGDALDRLLAGDMPWGTPSVMWRRRAIEAIGGWPKDLLRLEDVELHARALLRGLRFTAVDEVDWFVRLSPSDRLSKRVPDEDLLASDVRFFERVEAELEAAGRSGARAKRLLTSRAYFLVIAYGRAGVGDLGLRLWHTLEREGFVSGVPSMMLKLAATRWPGTLRWPAMGLQAAWLHPILLRRRLLRHPASQTQADAAARFGASLKAWGRDG